MFTIRFNNCDNTTYVVYSCNKYSVRHNESINKNGTQTATIVRMFDKDTEDNPYIECIGVNSSFYEAYVTNLNSVTVDVIREPK